VLGRVEYAPALELQLRICELKKHGFLEDVLLLLEHSPTITLGRNGKWENLLVSEQVLRSKGVSCFEADRGGDITFHGPGQLVGYPILQLDSNERDVHRYMRNLEESLIRVLARYGIEAGRKEKLTGIWFGERKIGALGVHISRWVTRHGFALNVDPDLSWFDLIVPCGLVGKKVTSMREVLSQTVKLEEVAERFVPEFGAVFDRKMVRLSAPELEEELKRCAGLMAIA